MPFDHIRKVFKNVGSVTKLGFGTILRDPSILAYPLLATFFVAVTYASVSGLVLAMWHGLEPKTAAAVVGSAQQQIPHQLRDKLGIVTFYYFYTAIVAAFFTCAASAAVWAKLQGHPTTVFHGLGVIFRRFFRVAWFAVLSVFFIPIALTAQCRKLLHHPIDVLGSSLNMHTGNLAPAIVNQDTGVFETVKISVKTLGGAYREGLVIKVFAWLAIVVLGAISFLPKFIQHYHFAGNTARAAGWITSAVLATTFFVLTKVISGVLLTVLYYDAQNSPEKYQ